MIQLSLVLISISSTSSATYIVGMQTMPARYYHQFTAYKSHGVKGVEDGETLGLHTQNKSLKARTQFMAECVFDVHRGGLCKHQ